MPRSADQSAIEAILGLPDVAPPSAQAPATLGSAPVVSSTPTPGQGISTDAGGRLPLGVAAQSVPVLTADPSSPVVGQWWYRQDTKQLSIRHNSTTTVRVTLA